MENKEAKKVLAWVAVRCPFCGKADKIEVTEKDASGKHVVRCPSCGERIPVDVTPPGVKTVEVNEPEVTVHDEVDTGK